MNEKYRKVATKMRGPLAPIMTPFDDRDGIDHKSLGRWVDWMATQGVPVLWTTGGTSEMLALTEQEVFDLTRTVCEANAGGSEVGLVRQFLHQVGVETVR